MRFALAAMVAVGVLVTVYVLTPTRTTQAQAESDTGLAVIAACVWGLFVYLVDPS
jgi:hypothetical protein